jgi:hypothetical protein
MMCGRALVKSLLPSWIVTVREDAASVAARVEEQMPSERSGPIIVAAAGRTSIHGWVLPVKPSLLLDP